MTVTLGDGARKLIDGANVGILGTLNPDGSPQTSVVWVGRDGDDVLISTAQGRRKEKNLRRDPRASLCVYDKADPLTYIEVRGTATVTEDAGRALAVALAERYEGAGAGEEYLALPPEVVRVVIRLTPRKVLGTGAE
ncbi:PPOX class F420-dependent enzyme [Sphaerisporangium siamense]|uniref:PPOX class probable F420-dependent enzyme n=1 Tax=Sphaerisporangium siamense TaxID=795645 RepID=A0A7W7D489_9ACTN|nr:PPOX class F420-dependent oxidoreductase [Sphaerisporangium siamense]MBB4699973.1 PPOX class probable F420-dependent enzyme [Sphaerisporangium siamense]GII84708.1 PPOX class F420-dependent enzyme [Sphaerisporangium siamense]